MGASSASALGALTLLALAACAGDPPPPARDAHPPGGDVPSSSATATAAAPIPSTIATYSPPMAPPPPAPGADGSDGGGAPARPTMISARHILIQYMGAQHAGSSVVRTKEQALSVAQEVLRRVKAGEAFERLAVEFSDEPGAGARGGSLGRFGHGQMVHEFEEAAFALSPGQISSIVETPFGFHVIQRTE